MSHIKGPLSRSPVHIAIKSRKITTYHKVHDVQKIGKYVVSCGSNQGHRPITLISKIFVNVCPKTHPHSKNKETIFTGLHVNDPIYYRRIK